MAKLDAAQRALDRGQAAVDSATLQALIHEVKAKAGKYIEADQVAHMLMHAKEIIDSLSQ